MLDPDCIVAGAYGTMGLRYFRAGRCGRRLDTVIFCMGFHQPLVGAAKRRPPTERARENGRIRKETRAAIAASCKTGACQFCRGSSQEALVEGPCPGRDCATQRMCVQCTQVRRVSTRLRPELAGQLEARLTEFTDVRTCLGCERRSVYEQFRKKPLNERVIKAKKAFDAAYPRWPRVDYCGDTTAVSSCEVVCIT